MVLSCEWRLRSVSPFWRSPVSPSGAGRVCRGPESEEPSTAVTLRGRCRSGGADGAHLIAEGEFLPPLPSLLPSLSLPPRFLANPSPRPYLPPEWQLPPFLFLFSSLVTFLLILSHLVLWATSCQSSESSLKSCIKYTHSLLILRSPSLHSPTHSLLSVHLLIIY